VITATINLDPTPSLFKYLPMANVTITDPVAGLWTISAPDDITQPVLDAARDAVLAFNVEMAHKVTLIGVAEAAITANTAFVDDFDTAIHVTTPVRAIGTVYTNGTKLRTVNAVIRLQANATTSTATYHTVIGGTAVVAQFGFVGTSGTTGGTAQDASFLVDPGAQYSITTQLGVAGGSGSQSVLSWVEVDAVSTSNAQVLAVTKQSTAALRVLTNHLEAVDGAT
jgi:hypothetical protein